MDRGRNPEWPSSASIAAKRPRLDASPQQANAKRPRLLSGESAKNDPFPDDIELSLKEIWENNNKISLLQAMKDIQEIYDEREEASDFIRNLKCLRLLKLGDTIEFKTEWIQDFKKDCVIASWTWEASEYESKQAGSCFIDDSRIPSKVRDRVWRRAASYMQNQQVDHLWIDAECIEQDDERKKEQAMEEMDTLYHRGSHPLGILTRPINKKDELRLLAEILRGDMLESEPSESTSEESLDSQLSGSTSEASLDSEASENTGEVFLKKEAIERASKGIELLSEITSDRWWTRAWIYQENYRGGQRMDLLMPHSRELENLKLKHEDLFGDLKEELIINSIQFSEALTDLCQAFIRYLCQAFIKSSTTGPRTELAQKILSTAGRYSVLLTMGSSMSPTLIADVGKRDVGNHPDRIPIIANCCSYNLRPNKQALAEKRCSYSLATLASFLLNGEIFKFRPDRSLRGKKHPYELTVVEFIQLYAFDRFSPPDQDDYGLTFNKSCRFSDVSLKAGGVHTKGHLWKLCQTEITIPTQQYKGQVMVEETLWDLHKYLVESDYVQELDREGELASRLKKLLRSSPQSPAEEYMWKMAETLVYALHKGQTLRLGYLYKSPGGPDFSPPTAIFIEPKPMHFGESPYVFTSFRERKTSGGPGYSCDVDKHVSLQVVGSGAEGRLPRLEAREWLHGLWFKTRAPREVLFTLPKVLNNPSGRPFRSSYHGLSQPSR